MRFTHQPGAQPLAGYTIRRGIQRGGFGEVYYAHSDGGKEVALKLLQREQDVELRGVRQCLNLKHPNLVNLFDVRTDSQGEQWVVMEYVNGSSLEDVLTSFPEGLPIDEIQDWLSGMVAGVAYLHDRGIVHRDLKPANVYRENGTVKVGDVGLSKRLGSDRRANHTQSVGTVYYMAPEVARGQYGPEIDVYALGIMLYEMLTGQLPFSGDTTAEVLMKHLTAHADLNRLPKELRPVIERALAKDPAKRTPSVFQLNLEFQNAVRNPSHPIETPIALQATSFANIEAEPASVGAKVQSTGPAPRWTPSVSTKSSAQAASAYAQTPGPGAVQSEPIPVVTNPTPSKPTKTSRRTNSSPPPHFEPSSNWTLIAAGILGLALFAPGSMRSWIGLGLLAIAIVAASFLRNRGDRLLQTGDAEPTVGAQSRNHRTQRSWGRASTSIAIGSLATCLMAVGSLLTVEFIQKNPQPTPPEFQAMFAATALAATWLILLTRLGQRKSKWLHRNSRKVFVVVGALIGTLAFGLDEYLLVDYTRPQGNYSPAFRSLGVHRLMDDGWNPTWLGYIVFFAGLMFWYRWTEETNGRQSHPFSLGKLCTAAIVAWVMTIVFAFPQWPAMLWAVTLSAAIQLATPHHSPDRQVTAGRR